MDTDPAVPSLTPSTLTNNGQGPTKYASRHITWFNSTFHAGYKNARVRLGVHANSVLKREGNQDEIKALGEDDAVIKALRDLAKGDEGTTYCKTSYDAKAAVLAEDPKTPV
jgi:hypothetical protein